MRRSDDGFFKSDIWTRRSAEVLTGTAVADIPTTAAIPTTGTAGMA